MRSEQLALQPSDVAYIATLLVLIEGGRKSLDAFKFRDCMTPLKVLCFLSDRVNLQSVKHYPNARNFLADMKSYIDEVEGVSDSEIENLFVLEILSALQNLKSIDDLVQYVDSIDRLFESDSTISPNEIMAPTKLCSDSSLGIYCRSFRAKWECLSFDSVYQLYESLRRFLSTADTASFNVLEGQEIAVLNNAPIDDDIGIDRFLLQAENAAVNGDVYTAEKLLHRYFDYNGNDPLLSVASKGSSLVSGMSCVISSKAALEALNHAKDPQFNASTRYQQSLLQLAAMWSKNGHYPLAMAAVEESMKTAHQRGDHGSVARALLLLYYVVTGLNRTDAGKVIDPDSAMDSEIGSSSSANTIGAEEVLRRCLDRCSTLGMNALAAQATVLLARLLSNRQCITWKQNNYVSDWLSPISSEDDGQGQGQGQGQNGNGSEETNNGISRYSSSSSSVKNIWTLLSSTLIGDAKLCCVLSKNGNGISLGSPSLSQAIPGVPIIKENNQELTGVEFFSIQIQAAIVSIEFWCRLNSYSQAELHCRRILRIISSSPFRDDIHISPEVTVVLYCKLCTLIVQSAFDIDEISFKDQYRGSEEHSLRECSLDRKEFNQKDGKLKSGNILLRNSGPESCNINDNYDINDNNENDDNNNSYKYEACKSAMEILKIAKNILSTESESKSSSPHFSSSKINNEIEATRTYIAIFHSLISISSPTFNLSKSIQLACRLVELTKDSEVQNSSQNDGKRRIIVNTSENAVAYLLLARLIGMDNRKESQDLLGKLEQSFLTGGLYQHSYEATVIKSFLSLSVKNEKEDDSDDVLNENQNQNSILMFHRILSSAKNYHYPVCETLICKYVSMISKVY